MEPGSCGLQLSRSWHALQELPATAIVTPDIVSPCGGWHSSSSGEGAARGELGSVEQREMSGGLSDTLALRITIDLGVDAGGDEEMEEHRRVDTDAMEAIEAVDERRVAAIELGGGRAPSLLAVDRTDENVQSPGSKRCPHADDQRGILHCSSHPCTLR